MIRTGQMMLLFCCGWILFSAAGCAAVHRSPLEVNLKNAPPALRDHVYPIVVLSPFDVAHLGGMKKLGAYLESCGYCQTEIHSLFTDGTSKVLTERVCEIKSCDPQARVMFIGFSFSCVMIHNALCNLEEQGICVESVCYIDSAMLKRFIRDPHPNNVEQIVMAYREINPAPPGVPRSRTYYLGTRNHFKTPTHARTVHEVLREIQRITFQGYCGGTRCVDRGSAVPVSITPAESGVSRFTPVQQSTGATASGQWRPTRVAGAARYYPPIVPRESVEQ